MTRGERPRPAVSIRGNATIRRNATAWLFAGPATLIIVGLSVFPAVWSLLLSQQRWDGITAPRYVGFRNYTALAADPELYDAVGHTVFFTAIFVPASLVLGVLLAVALNRRIRFLAFYRTCVFVPFVTSAAATGILANFVFEPRTGIVNGGLRMFGIPAQGFLEDPGQAMFVLCLVALWGALGFTVVVYLAALQDIPAALYEAAQIDGASRWQMFRRVTLPQLLPVTIFTAVWQTITALQLFDVVFTTTRGGPVGATRTIVYFIYHQAFERAEYGYGSAAALSLFVVSVIITIGMMVYARFKRIEAF
ncbi:sugar ABC transporter permease [Spongiactinospora rosea]|uniref:Sugar ABC transporter permease n=1 Tax=Spongiactinospora rosea TaxID=2248750 RepID=A0A366LQ21_9ACTN|nr:sugar ABC transporter permease [Spongiactinospora rosea]RBQ15740.1 sugar ABC transporter permease [Spongiactinospora rosea]